MKSIPSWVWLVGALVYVVCPLDFDFVPVVGWLDDLAVAWFGIQKFWEAQRLTHSPSAVAGHRGDDVIDAVRVTPSQPDRE